MIPKFRCWIKNKGLMCDVLMIEFDEKGVGVEYAPDSIAYFPFDEIELMQSTGLKDKNGVEIFESDVIKYEIDGGYCEGRIAIIKEVGYERGHFYPFLHGREEFHQKAYPEYCEIIGNIYQNENLLTK